MSELSYRGSTFLCTRSSSQFGLNVSLRKFHQSEVVDIKKLISSDTSNGIIVDLH
ncbi:MAG: hypothetical protein M3239_01345 [Thermoproteota archaeon]|nr:hypothetical protein [Thermoproteota archaeon]